MRWFSKCDLFMALRAMIMSGQRRKKLIPRKYATVSRDKLVVSFGRFSTHQARLTFHFRLI